LTNVKRPNIVNIPPNIIEKPTPSENKKYAITDAIIGSPKGNEATMVGCKYRKAK